MDAHASQALRSMTVVGLGPPFRWYRALDLADDEVAEVEGVAGATVEGEEVQGPAPGGVEASARRSLNPGRSRAQVMVEGG